MKTFTFDVETDGIDDVSVIHCLLIQDADLGPESPVLRFNDQPTSQRAGTIAEGLALLATADRVVGHNVIGYDIPVIRKVRGFTLPRNINVYDTLVVSQMMWGDMLAHDCNRKGMPQNNRGEHGLESWGVRLGRAKGKFGKTTDWKTWTREMEDYCEGDVRLNTQLYQYLLASGVPDIALDLETRFSQLMQRQQEHGFRFDEAAAGHLYAKLLARKDELTKTLQSVFPPNVVDMRLCWWHDAKGDRHPTKKEAHAANKISGRSGVHPGKLKTKSIPFNPGSRPQIAAQLQRLGWKPKKMTDKGRICIDDGVLSEALLSLDLPECDLLSEFLLLCKRIGALATGDNAWLILARKGRMHGRVISSGCVTGRCAHVRPNMGQIPSTDKPYGHECRALFTADDGQLLVGADASGLELRMLGHFMARYDGGEYASIVSTGDVHTANQLAFGLPPGKTGRDWAKTGIYALIYGAGDEKFATALNGGKPLKFTPEELATLRQQWSDKKDEIRQFYYRNGLRFRPPTTPTMAKGMMLRYEFMKNKPAYTALLAAALAKFPKNKRKGQMVSIRGIDGRPLWVRSPHSILNTIFQSAGALAVKLATVIWAEMLEEKGLVLGVDWAPVAHVHDEAQATSKPEHAELVGKTFVLALAEAGKRLGFRVPLTGEYKIGRNWAETH